MRDIFLAGLSAELDAAPRRRRDLALCDLAPLRDALALKGGDALRALRALPDRAMDACSSLVGFDADDVCQKLLATPGL